MEWLLMEIAQSYDLESSPATCPGIPLLEFCHLLPVGIDLTFSGTHLGSTGLKGMDWPLASLPCPVVDGVGQLLVQDGLWVAPVKGVSALIQSSRGRPPSTQGSLGTGQTHPQVAVRPGKKECRVGRERGFLRSALAQGRAQPTCSVLGKRGPAVPALLPVHSHLTLLRLTGRAW